MKQIAIALLLLTAACAPKLQANDVGGVVRPATPDTALPIAERHCEQFGKAAQISSFTPLGSVTTFNCVAKS